MCFISTIAAAQQSNISDSAFKQGTSQIMKNGRVHPHVLDCPPGYHWDTHLKKCVKCPPGSHWDGIGCTLDGDPPPPLPIPPTISYTPLFTTANFTKTIDLSKSVGTIAGMANVNGGAVSYTIPIFVAPGTNGVQPSIGISYNSQAGSGIVGYGWNISGLSVIGRSGKNMYNDGIVQPIKYTHEDGFVLDGMRLYPIAGANGDNGTIYAGESETFAQIISNTTSSPNNPNWFKVTTKDGTVLEYGNTADLRTFMVTGRGSIKPMVPQIIH